MLRIRRFGKNRCGYNARAAIDDLQNIRHVIAARATPQPVLAKVSIVGCRCGIIFVMHPLFEKADALTGEVIDAAVEVQKHFGIGLLENIYKQALAQEMRIRGHQAETEVDVPITYKGFTFEEKLRIDCFVDRCLIVECKSLDEEKVNMIRHKAQLLSYMKLMNVPLGLVINFGDYRLGKRGVARVILKGADGGDPF